MEWLGEIPVQWQVKGMRRVTQRRVLKNDDEIDRPMLSLSAYQGIVLKEYEDETLMRPKEDSLTYMVVEPGQLVVNPMWVINSGIGVSSLGGIVSPAYRVYDISPEFDGVYLHNLVKSTAYLAQYNRYIRGLTTYDRSVREEDFGSIEVLIPPLPEQRAIAAFLDRETVRIDTLVERKERLIALLQEKRAALITRAVTNGLDPHAPMVDSGVEWLGQVPAHWAVLSLRRVIARFVDYRGQTPQKVPSGIPLITAANIKSQKIDFSLSEQFIPEDLYAAWMVRGLPETGDVLITTEAPLGESAQIVHPNVALAQRIILLKADKAKITNDYLLFHFAADSGKSELWTRATGSTALGIKASHLKETRVLCPPIEEQQKITHHIGEEIPKIDALVAKIREAIDRLKEYRSALISAAVTGQIDVRGETDAA